MSNCPRCGGPHLERQCRFVISRRRFLFLGTAAAAAVAAGPLVELAPATPEWWGPATATASSPFDWAAVDRILKEVYEPLIVDIINKPRPLLKLLQEEGYAG